MTDHDTPAARALHDRIVEQQQRWHGWGSPVGISLSIALIAAGLAVVVASISLLT